MPSLPILTLFAGVLIVRPRLPSFLRGGDGGLTKTGDEGADVRSAGLVSAGTNGADIIARPRLYADAVFTARPLRFRGFFDDTDAVCFCISKKS
jgi:hypothetical protein